MVFPPTRIFAAFMDPTVPMLKLPPSSPARLTQPEFSIQIEACPCLLTGGWWWSLFRRRVHERGFLRIFSLRGSHTIISPCFGILSFDVRNCEEIHLHNSLYNTIFYDYLIEITEFVPADPRGAF